MLDPFETPATDALSATERRQPARLRARRSDPRDDRHARTGATAAMTRCRIDVHRAARVDLDHEDLRVVAVRGVHRVDDELRVRRVDEAVDLDHVDGPAARASPPPALPAPNSATSSPSAISTAASLRR